MRNRTLEALRALHRSLVPMVRGRRRHLALVLRQPYTSPSTGELVYRYQVLAVVRPEDRQHLRPLVQLLAEGHGLDPLRLGLPRDQDLEGVDALRLASAEDGLLDGSMLWAEGAPVDDLVVLGPKR
jgi:hypothetical protein